MGRSGKIILVALLASLMLQSCVREDSLLQEDVTARRSAMVRLTVCADRAVADPTRIASGEDGRLQWEGDESIGIIFAKQASSTTNYRYIQELKSVPGRPGVFSGNIDPGKYKLSDIVGMVCPFSEESWGKCHSSKGKRIVMRVGATDGLQPHSGEPQWDDVPFFAEISSSDLVKDGDGYVIGGKTFRCGAALIGVTVYGRHPDGSVGEKLQSVRLNASTSVCCVGTSEWNISSDSFAFNGISDKAYIAVRLGEPEAMGLQASSGATVYMPSLPRGETGGKVKFTKVKVVTDKAVYTKSISQTPDLMAGSILPVSMDLATFERVAIPYSTLKYENVSLRRGAVNSFVYNYYEPFSDRPIEVFYYIPSKGDITTMPILFSMHGNGRGGQGACSNWSSTAESKGVIVVAPCFSAELYPNADYHLGGISYSTSSYMPRPFEQRTYNIIEELFDMIKDKTGNTSACYDLSGHSAGSQFTHRMLLNMPDCRVGRAVASNAGYYTFPVPDGIADAAGEVYSFPYSINGMDMPVSQLAAFFARNLTVHVGTADIATTVEEDADLPVSAGAEAQGACRYERGKYFFARSKAVADSLGLPFNWRLVEVPGVAHSASKMIKSAEVGAAALLYP